jgi:hypothetical protein
MLGAPRLLSVPVVARRCKPDIGAEPVLPPPRPSSADGGTLLAVVLSSAELRFIADAGRPAGPMVPACGPALAGAVRRAAVLFMRGTL